MTTRRAFIRTLFSALLAAPLAVEAQPAGKVWRIGARSGSPLCQDKNLDIGPR